MSWVKDMTASELAEFLKDPENVSFIPEEDLDRVLDALNIDGRKALQHIEDIIDKHISETAWSNTNICSASTESNDETQASVTPEGEVLHLNIWTFCSNGSRSAVESSALVATP